MSEFDPTELITLCDSILDFGEVTESEAYNLADWLNKHDEAYLHWPGEDLVRSLQEVWGDGKVTRTEWRRLTGLLRSIHKECTKMQFDESMKSARQEVEQLAGSMPPLEPRLPPINLTVSIKSVKKMCVTMSIYRGQAAPVRIGAAAGLIYQLVI